MDVRVVGKGEFGMEERRCCDPLEADIVILAMK